MSAAEESRAEFRCLSVRRSSLEGRSGERGRDGGERVSEKRGAEIANSAANSSKGEQWMIKKHISLSDPSRFVSSSPSLEITHSRQQLHSCTPVPLLFPFQTATAPLSLSLSLSKISASRSFAPLLSFSLTIESACNKSARAIATLPPLLL